MRIVGRLVAFIAPLVLAAGSVPASARVVESRVALGGPAQAYRAPVAAYRWPLDGVPVVVRRFAPPPKPWLPGHRGVDLAASVGASVRAAGGGVVVFAGVIAGRGVVSVEHAGGLRTTYEPVEPSVHAGAHVDAGVPLGTLAAGHPGCPTVACLHWGLRRGATYLDPLGLIGPARVRLLPLHPGEEGG
jgi:murein DD-endopeptidase MepM/ murein hydrolase activator NlpD